MGEEKEGSKTLVTLTELRERFPATDGGYRPSLKLLRETARRLGLGRKWGRSFYLTEAEASALTLAGSERKPMPVDHPIRPPRFNQTSAVQRALELNERLMKLRKKRINQSS
jgi:hypothetical protein